MTSDGGYDPVRNPQPETDWTDWVESFVWWIVVLFAPSALFIGMCLLANWAHR